MADNYIERQYEQYEARKAAWEKARKLGKKKVKAVRQKVKRRSKSGLVRHKMLTFARFLSA